MQRTSKVKAFKIVFIINTIGLLFFCFAMSRDMFGQVVYQTDAITLQQVNSTSKPSNLSRPHYVNKTVSRKMVTNIAFLKVHKASSTTMQNLFFRFGLKHNLNILLPKKGNYISNLNEMIPLKPPNTYNIFAIHTVYSKQWFDKLIPGGVKIGIVREPVDRMVSAAYYYRDVWKVPFLKKIPQANFIHNLISEPEKYNTYFFSQTRNAMGRDFGFKRNIRENDSKQIKAYLDKLNEEFLLVMVVERFDESLVMMKHMLSWSFLDIIYLKANSHTHKPVVLNEQEKKIVRETNFLDFAIYEYFTKVFEEKLSAMPDDFNEEVDYFKELLERVRSFCSKEDIEDDSKLSVEQSAWDETFDIRGIECKWMTTRELTFIKEVRQLYVT